MVNIIAEIIDRVIIRSKNIKKKLLVSSNTKNGFFIHKRKDRKNPKLKKKALKNNFPSLLFLEQLSHNKQIYVKIKKPNGNKKQGGNNNENINPKKINFRIFNYFLLFLKFQFFYYQI